MLGDSVPTADGDPFALVGTIFDRKFRIDRVVAHGGFGVVYHGHHLALGVELALKVLKPQRTAEGDEWTDLLDQFLEEAKTLAKLRHANVVAVLDAGIAYLDGFPAGVPWMALEWLAGATLRDELAVRRGKGGRPPRECLDLLRPVLEAMSDAHEAGIVHRDLKPSNIMIVPTKLGTSAHVLDFGIAKMMEPELAGHAASGQTATVSRTAAFTPASAAPEQLSGTRSSARTDVYGLALMICEVLTDLAPLPFDDANEHYRAVFAASRPTPAKMGVDVGAWEPILARALAVLPKERPPDARALLGELVDALPNATHRALDGAEPVAPGPAQRHEDTSEASGYAATDRRPRRSPWALRSVGVALLAGVGALAVGARSMSGRTATVASSVDAAAARSCSAKACSASLGAPAVCGRGAQECVRLASEDCVVRAEAGDLARDDTVWIGAMFPTTGPGAAEFGVWNHHAVELARRDFASVMGGVAGGRARPLAILECDDAADATRAAKHLVDDVGAPAVIGFRSGIEAMELSNALFMGRGVLVVSATNTNPMLTKVPQPLATPHLVFRTTYSTADAASAIGELLRGVLEPELRAVPGVVDAPLRVATLRAKAAAGADIADALRENLRFNGKTAIENGEAYQELSYDLASPVDNPDLGRVVAALLAFRPHVIVYAGSHAAAHGILAPVEKRWPAGAVPPRWVSVSELTDDLFAVLDPAPAARRRFYGVTPVSETSANARFVQHYRETFDEPVTRTDAPNSTYDAFYLLAFATYGIAAGDPVNGASLARAIGNLVPPGAGVEVGVPDIFEAYQLLASGQRIDLTGATGKLDFDLARGEASFDHSILCVTRDAAGKLAGVPSGLVYRATTRHLEGSLRCP